MSDLSGPGDPAGDPGVAGDPALPPPPDDWLLRDFLQVRALAQHANVAARLDAFAAAHDAVTDEAPDGGGVGPRSGTKDDDPAAPPVSPGGAAPRPVPASDPAAADAVPPTAPSAPPAAVAPPLAEAESAPPHAAPGGKSLWSGVLSAAQSAATNFYNQSILKPIDDVGQLSRDITRDPLGTISSIADSFPGTKMEGEFATAAVAGLASAKAGSIGTLGALRRYLGSAGVDMQWHHIVEQSQIPQFGPEAIHDVKNVVAVPTEIHQAINAIYSSKPRFADGSTVREWLRGKSFAEQYEFGVQQLAKLMGYETQ
jgi:hypothetical protein